MNPEKKKRLEDAGWTVGSAGEFVGLPELDDAVILEQDNKTCIVSMLCPICKIGNMKMDKAVCSVLLTDPPQYQHICSHCDYKARYRTIYPFTFQK